MQIPQGSQGLVALVFSSFLSSGCASLRHAIDESIAYQKGLEVVYTQTIPGQGTYDVFVDTRTATCAVDFTPIWDHTLSPDPFYRSLSDYSYPRHPDLFYETELMDKHCPKQGSPPVSSVPSPQSL